MNKNTNIQHDKFGHDLQPVLSPVEAGQAFGTRYFAKSKMSLNKSSQNASFVSEDSQTPMLNKNQVSKCLNPSCDL